MYELSLYSLGDNCKPVKQVPVAGDTCQEMREGKKYQGPSDATTRTTNFVLLCRGGSVVEWLGHRT